MTQLQKILDRVLRGTSDAGVAFDDLRRLLLALDFQERIRGRHYIFSRDGAVEILNNPEPATERQAGKGVSGQAGQKCHREIQIRRYRR